MGRCLILKRPFLNLPTDRDIANVPSAVGKADLTRKGKSGNNLTLVVKLLLLESPFYGRCHQSSSLDELSRPRGREFLLVR